MSPVLYEAFLARIYTDERARRQFLRDPFGEATRFGLSSSEASSLASIDLEGLALAAAGFSHRHRNRPTLHGRLQRLLRRWAT